MKNMLFAASALVAVLAPATAYAQETDSQDYGSEADLVSGFRIEGQALWENISDPEDDVIYKLGSGIAYGGEVGYDVAVSETVVVGPFANYSASTVEDCTPDFCVGSKGFWAVGIHAGVVAGENGMAYAKLGYGSQTVYAEGLVFNPATGQDELVSDEETGGGYHFAFGYEHRFGAPFYGRAELGIGTATDIFGFDFQRGHIGLALGARF